MPKLAFYFLFLRKTMEVIGGLVNHPGQPIEVA